MSFKFVNEAYTGIDAAGGTADTSYNLNGVFKNATYDQKFRLGNTGASETTFTCTASGLESSITDAVTFSTDGGLTWDTTAGVSGVQPNEISDIIIARLTVPDDAYLCSGTYLIRVDEV